MNNLVYIGNRGGIPIVQTSPVVGTADVRFVLPSHIFRFLGQKGIVALELTSAIPTGTTATLPILAEVNGATNPIVDTSGTALTAGTLGTAIYIELLFDKTSNSLVVIS